MSGGAAGPAPARSPFALVTARLYLRPCTRDDAAALHALWTDPVVRRHLWDDEVIRPARAIAAVERALADADAHALGFWVVHVRAEGDGAGADSGPAPVAGFAGFRDVRTGRGGREAELLVALAPAHHGRGYATEAARALLGYAFHARGLARVRAGVEPGNHASIRLLERLGMGREPAARGGRLAFALARDAFDAGAIGG